ncbi:hypothetical protein KIY83_gp33 [Mycobacterium phage Fameo]|uniref:Uncharacterized protein n=1 Tax=Mycobacterium phage Fameo TaxID=2126943 RepID=A0A2R4AP10_9CAUD|nr:hypothetical protein KIY83_gp33 [Mycobacterium phage Fameo]AVR76803.1 hypothetical protein SEA_FAMEO_33 [Mycobacterium phage Fameo]
MSVGYGIEYTPKARRKVVDIRPKAGPVTVTKADGTQEIVPPLPPKKTRKKRRNR